MTNTQNEPVELLPNYIDVVFDGPPGPEAGRFVECEGPDGRSLSAGEWINRGDGYYALRIHTRPALAAVVDALREALIRADYEWHGPFGNEKHRIIPPALFDRILSALEGDRS